MGMLLLLSLEQRSVRQRIDGLEGICLWDVNFSTLSSFTRGLSTIMGDYDECDVPRVDYAHTAEAAAMKGFF